MTSFRNCHILQPENPSPKRDLNLRNSFGSRLGKQTCCYITCRPKVNNTLTTKANNVVLAQVLPGGSWMEGMVVLIIIGAIMRI